MDARRYSSEESPAPALAWIGTDDGADRRVAGRRPWFMPLVASVLLVVAGVVAWQAAQESDWPSGCPVSGHPDWCAAPSEAITDPALVELARSYCPALSSSARGDVVPQPLSELGLADERTFAMTTGGEGTGSEDALLGRPGAVAWVTRWQDGLVQVRCPGSSATTPSLGLRPDQFRSTVAGDAAELPRVAFSDVAKDMIAGRSAQPRADVSYGFLTCDTDGIDLEQPEPGETFSCVVEMYALQGRGSYRASYRIADERPYFVPVREQVAGT